MANIGLSQPYYAKYANTNGTTAYTGLTKLGKAVNVDISTEGKDPQILYADNGPAESLAIFGGGTATMDIDELEMAVAKDILSLTATIGGTGVIFPADNPAPYVGLGFIVKKVHENVIKWRLVVLYKCQFKVPDYSISTQGETVEFQTPSLEATILRDDCVPAKWQMWDDYASEAAALAALQTALGGTAVTTE